jgi:hypothetical protein
MAKRDDLLGKYEKRMDEARRLKNGWIQKTGSMVKRRIPEIMKTNG